MPRNLSTSASATSAVGNASIPMRIGIETCGPKIGSAAISLNRASVRSAWLVASAASTARVIRCCSSSPLSSIA